MGIIQSHSDVDKRTFSEFSEHSLPFEDSVNNPVDDEDSIDNPFSEDVLIEVLSRVPAKDLLCTCRLVCKEWKCVIDAQSIWRLKCERENIKLPTRKFSRLPDRHYQYVYCHSISKTKNLLKNPCGEEKFKYWDVGPIGDRAFAIENPPVGSDPVPAEVGSQSCFATTFFECAKEQIVGLCENSINSYLLRHDLVKIKVGEWYAARFDCASEYQLKVIVYNQCHHVIDQFDFKYIEEQWKGRTWHLVTHEFDDVPAAHFIEFHHQGKDRQFWDGHYGSKMTGAFVELCIK